jgi:hypothetical protein
MFGTTLNQLRKVVYLSVGVAMMAACSSPGSESGQVDMAENLRQRNDIATRSAPLYQSVREALPDQSYLLDGRDVRASEVFVAGTVVSVEAARSFLWELEDDVETRVEVKNDDPRRQVTTYHMLVSVEKSVVAPLVDPPKGEVVVGIATSAGSSSIKVDSLVGQRVAVVLAHSAVFDYDPQVFSILQDGGLLGLVSDTGEISFPVLPADDPLISGGKITLDDLLNSGDRQPIIASLNKASDSYVRAN